MPAMPGASSLVDSVLRILEAELQPEIDRGRVTVLLNTEVTDLIQAGDGAVTGVVTRDLAGETARHSGHNVLLTCGGYASNAQMFEELEGARDYSDVSYEYSQGAGITLGLAAGGYTRGGEYHLPLFGGILADDNYPSRMIGVVRHFPPEPAALGDLRQRQGRTLPARGRPKPRRLRTRAAGPARGALLGGF